MKTANQQIVTFCIPFLSSVAFLLLAFGLPKLGVKLPSFAAPLMIGAAIFLLVLALYLSRRAGTESDGGGGGRASVKGNDSTAIGGIGGDARGGIGGVGGDATVTGNRSVAIGGRGGTGGPTRRG